MKNAFTATIVLCLFTTVSHGDTIVGFDGGSNDGFTGNAVYEAAGGNPGGNAHINAGGPFFFPEIRTGGIGEPSNASLIGDFSSFDVPDRQ